jgi:hypothetical protein
LRAATSIPAGSGSATGDNAGENDASGSSRGRFARYGVAISWACTTRSTVASSNGRPAIRGTGLFERPLRDLLKERPWAHLEGRNVAATRISSHARRSAI